MRFRHHPGLCCPHDGLPLIAAEGCLRCGNGHSFDIARRGYVNLLGAGERRSRDPGDSREMVAARRRFLDRGHYQPIADRIRAMLENRLDRGGLIVDAGCGDGYYLQQLSDRLVEEGASAWHCIGFDISKWAVQAAAGRFPATWLVASNRHIPLADRSADVLLDLFGFASFAEFHRVLRPAGTLVHVAAGRNHLLELRDLLYDEVAVRDRPLEVPQGFARIDGTGLSFSIAGLEQDALADLLLMTPHMFRAPAAGRQRAAACARLDVTVDVRVTLLEALSA